MNINYIISERDYGYQKGVAIECVIKKFKYRNAVSGDRQNFDEVNYKNFLIKTFWRWIGAS